MAEELTHAGLSPEDVDTLFDLNEATRAAEEQDRAQGGPPEGEGFYFGSATPCLDDAEGSAVSVELGAGSSEVGMEGMA